MRPRVVGGACHRLHQQLETALSEGVLKLPPDLAAHAERCPYCGPEVRETEELFRRLRAMPAHIDLGPVPGVVDRVLQRIEAEGSAADLRQAREQAEARRRKLAHLLWVLGQVAAVAAVLLIALGGLTYVALKVNQVAMGVKLSGVVERWREPFQYWMQALFRGTP